MPDGQPILDRSGSASPTWDERFKAVAFSEFQFLAILSSEGRVLEISQAALHAGGVARAEVIEQPFWETVWCRKAPEASDYWQGRLVAARASVGNPVHGRSLLHWPGRGDEFVDNSVTMVPLADGGVDYFVVQAKLTASRVDEEEGVRNQDERFKFVAQATNDAIWDWDVAQNLLWWSDGFTRLFGFERGELEAGLESWTRRVHPADRDAVVRDFHTAVEGSADSWAAEYRFLCKDGRAAHVLDRGRIIRDAAGKAVRMVGGMTDLTASKEAERLLARSNRALKMLSECNEVMTRATGERELLSQICRLAVEKGGYRMAWVGYAQQDEEKTIKPMAFAGEEQGYLSEIVLTWQSSDPRGWGPGGQVIRSGRLVFAEDILDTSSGFHWVEPAVRRGYRSVICLPLKEGHHTFGMLALYTGEVQMTGPEELKLLQDLADDLAYGIQHLRSQDERRRMETAVLKIAASVSASIGTIFFKQLARNMAEALGAHASFVAKLLPGEPARARTMAAVVDGKVNADFEFTLKGKPAEHLLEEGAWVVPARVVERYPEADMLRELRAEAYVGCRLVDANGTPVGLLFVIFQEPIEKADFINTTLKIFAARAAAELERQDSDRCIRQQASLLDKAQDAILVRDLNNRILFWSKGAERIYGWRADEVMGKDVTTLLYRDAATLRNAMNRVMETGEWTGELRHVSKDGDRLIVEGRWTLLRDNEGLPQSILAINTDITDKKKLEQQFLRAQRMESIGTLAGGIAHDLNNVLSPITMAIDLLKLSVTGEMNQELLATVADSARRGAEMVRQVLSFARGMDGQRILIQVRHLVKDLEKIIRDTFPKSINLRVRLEPDLMPLLGDATQLHQVLLNLCVNSRDAMPGGGDITITAQNVRLTTQEAARYLDARAGQYVRVQVKDNGVGIPPAIIEKVFDPFFTTKEVGKGTGLGLSTSLAIVKGHEGFIRLDSNEGGGTIFEIYLPACPEENPALEDKRVLDCPRGAGECVLVVDDEEMIRQIARQTLLAYGYKVLLAADGMEALATYLKNRDQIAVVITDMMMPVMDGAATIKGLMAINPLVKIIAASGITANDQLARASGVGVKQFLAKPYSVESLLIALRQTIHETPG